VIAMTGAGGEIGRRVASRLAGLGAVQRLIVRHAASAPMLPGAEVVEASSYGDASAMRRALAGVQTLLLISARDRFGVAHISAKNHTAPAPYDRVEQHRVAVEAAVAAGVHRVVYLSVIHAAPDATFILAHDHYHTEEHIRASGMRFTFLRTGLYADNVPHSVSADGVIRVPAGDGRVAWVTRDDVAHVAAAVLTSPGHEEPIYDVTGPEAMTMAETAATLSIFAGREIVYQAQTLEDARTTRTTSRLEKFDADRRMWTGQGLSDYEADVFITHFLQIAEGDLAQVSDTVPKLTGRPAQSLAEYLRQHPESYRHLLPTIRL
jgi:NAD(P)H dehydrogenase (quinone)